LKPRRQSTECGTTPHSRVLGLSDEEIRRMFEAELAGLRKTGGQRG